LSVAAGRLEPLRALWEAAAAEWPAEAFARREEYELELRPAAVADGLLVELGRLEPHGEGNPRPAARVGPLRLAGTPRVFGKRERKHLAAVAEGEDGARVSLLGWGWGGRLGDLAGRFEVLAHLERDRYTGGPTLRLIDSRPYGSG
ncbi:MAG TPA: hypothetical protein VF150_03595, partial [Thermoanaerobaculia bacterium]